MSFGQRVASMRRVLYAEREQAAWTSMIAAQGPMKSMKEWVQKLWGSEPVSDRTPVDDTMRKILSGGGF